MSTHSPLFSSIVDCVPSKSAIQGISDRLKAPEICTALVMPEFNFIFHSTLVGSVLLTFYRA